MQQRDQSPIPSEQTAASAVEELDRGALTRRRLLVGGAAAAGVAVAGAATLGAVPRLGAVAAGAADEVSWQPRFLTPEQAGLTSRLCDLILPRTATAGALDVGVPEWIDLALSLGEAEDQLAFLGGLAWIEQRSSTLHGGGFTSLGEAGQVALLQEIGDGHDSNADNLEAGAAFFSDLKRRTLFAYFTSEKGRVEALGRPAKVQRETLQGCTHSGDDHSA